MICELFENNKEKIESFDMTREIRNELSLEVANKIELTYNLEEAENVKNYIKHYHSIKVK